MSFKKLNWLQNGDIRLTQGYHGQFQGGKALDFDRQDLFAPEECQITRIYKDTKNPYNSFVDVNILNTVGRVYYQIVHFETDKREGYIFKEKEKLGYCTSNHYHIGLNVVGKWESVLDFTKRDRNIVLIGQPWSKPYNQWSFYNDRSIQFQSNNPTPIRTYRVVAGDNLTNITKKHYGITDNGLAHNKMLEVARFNNFSVQQRNNLTIGQIIKLP